MAAALPFMQMVGGVVSSVGALRQGQMSEAVGDFNAQINRQNAEIARNNALQKARQIARENYLRLGAINAAQGKSGGTASGSVLDVIADVAAQGELQKQTALYEGELKARGYTNTANLDQFGGEQAKEQSYLTAGSELLKGGSAAGTSFSRMG